jgi:hypothetical protein
LNTVEPNVIQLNAGPHDRVHTPIEIDIGSGIAIGALVDDATGEEVPCQIHQGKLHFILEGLLAGESATYRFVPGQASAAPAKGVSLRLRMRSHCIDVRVLGRPFTTYHFAPGAARPFFHPFLGPNKKRMTRAYPMETVEGETNDHEHHRSVWVAHGDVNGTDNWSEVENHGWQVHRDFSSILDGPVLGEFRQALDWQDPARETQLTETRTVRFLATPDASRCMDLTVALTASEGDVRLGDTKEGGICSVRVATSMDADKGGQLRNSAGGIGEAECWGKPAHWCDFEGEVEGKKAGIAIFDHPLNFRHPTCWHVRGYGLMTANPFGYSDYQSSFTKEGSYTLPAGDTLTFRYRIFLHRPDSKRSTVADRYQDYANPPAVDVLRG